MTARSHMDTVVVKYGGSSLAGLDQIRAVARQVAGRHRAGQRIVVVVSARGDTTDDLLGLAAQLGVTGGDRELDQLLATGETASAATLSMALQQLDVPAVSLTGPQCGILGTGKHGAAIIVAVDTERVSAVLQSGHVVVTAGFQCINANGDTVTLGRGGSDTTAVAIAAELRVPLCEIYTDVLGVYTADPRIVGGARLLPSVDIGVMSEMSFAGAKVMHSRAVELAAMYGVRIRVAHASKPGGGTVIGSQNGEEMLEASTAVMAVVHDPDVARVTLRVRAQPLDVLQALARSSLPVDMADLREGSDGESAFQMTVRRSDTGAVRESLRETVDRGRGTLDVDASVGKLSVIGTGLLSRPEYAARMVSALATADIPARSITSSQSRISVTVPDSELVRAVGVLHDEFGLESTVGDTVNQV
nr:aspartate kinase [Kibdelosporangium sp. MJ126-NF4]CTQ92560.1 Aspartokinase (EC 2.7.2.4) [Kibdelosporangium sp. MJ126-NF4]